MAPATSRRASERHVAAAGQTLARRKLRFSERIATFWKRLSCWSSVLSAPWGLISKDCVEDGEEFAGDGDEGDHFQLAGGDELLAEGLEVWIVPRSDQCAHVKRPCKAPM